MLSVKFVGLGLPDEPFFSDGARFVRRPNPTGCSALRRRPTETALAFPLRGRWHGVAVTDEGRGQAGVSATPKQEVQTLISHQCAHWCQLPPRGKPRGCAPRQSLPHRGRGTAQRWMRQTPKVCGKPGFSLISRLRRQLPPREAKRLWRHLPRRGRQGGRA